MKTYIRSKDGVLHINSKSIPPSKNNKDYQKAIEESNTGISKIDTIKEKQKLINKIKNTILFR